MIPEKLSEAWEKELQRTEPIFLARNGGGYPDTLNGLTPAGRRVALGRLGYRIAEEYRMPDDDWAYTVPWCRLTDGVAVCLQDGFVTLSSKAGDGDG